MPAEARTKKAAAHRLDEIAIRIKMICALANPYGSKPDHETGALVCDVIDLCEGREPDPLELDLVVRMLKRVVDNGPGMVDDCYAKEAQQHLVSILVDAIPQRHGPCGYVKTDDEGRGRRWAVRGCDV